MPHMNGTGPLGQGSQDGRRLGSCTSDGEKDLSKMGKGMGMQRKAGRCDGLGQGKRRRYEQ